MKRIKKFDGFFSDKSKEKEEISLTENDKWVQSAHIKKGALKKQLGYSDNEKIPASILNKIATAKIGDTVEINGSQKKVTALLKKRAVLAKTLKGMH